MMAVSFKKEDSTKKENLLCSPTTMSENDGKDDFIIPVEALPHVQIPHQVVAYNGLPVQAMVSYIESPSLFYLHLVNSETATIDRFCLSMMECYKDDKEPLQVNQLPLGSHWAVFNSDGLWYRCKILSNLLSDNQNIMEGGPRVKVHFIDYGNCIEVHVRDVRALSKEFTLLPALAVPCSLAKVYPQHTWEKSPWALESVEAFQKLCGGPDSVLQTYFTKLNWSGRNEVILETKEGLVINEELVVKGYAISKVLLQVANSDQVSCEVTSIPIDASENSAVLETLPLNWNPMESAYLNPTNSASFNDECAESVFLGFKNTDEMRLCKYFRRGLCCPRGDACRWEHVRQYEGVTVEKEEVIAKCGMPSLPEIGTIVSACVTYMISPAQLYIFFPHGIGDLRLSDDIYEENQENFATLFEAMREHYKNIHPKVRPTLPACGELLVHCHIAQDGMECLRVRVLEVNDEYEIPKVKVFFLDVGNIAWVREDQLKPLAIQFSHMPPQGISSRWYTFV
ncbi:uncharacterized protein LOC122251686 isoform X2 [Penaeus japonicus]|uniref:uncharacterized protein LOC122251686 isoform X2 n=1 Tax=Penaeus japonicus TaxID=27405 RepID=UPI001C70FE88|nr:uncharacterized protein LOC122251686 isoform X2 [Penaeus japonicus]